MSGASVTFEVTELPRARQILSDCAEITRNKGPLLMAIGTEMQRETGRNFRRERDPITGKSWPRSKRAIAQSSDSRPGTTLFNDGKLLGSVLRGTPKVEGNSVTIGSSHFSARVHNDGLTIKPKRANSLAIPVSREAIKAGSARAFIESMEGADRPSFYFKRGDTGFIAHMKGYKPGVRRRQFGKSDIKAKPGVLVIDFILKKEIKMPQRRFYGVGKIAKQAIVSVIVVRYHKALQRRAKRAASQ